LEASGLGLRQSALQGNLGDSVGFLAETIQIVIREIASLLP
jgi:hypothetical protein